MGGSSVPRGTLGWNALILTWGQQTCSGSLINPYLLLTAGHCGSPDSDVTIYTVSVGRWNWTDPHENLAQRVDFVVSKIIRHPKFMSTTLFNDLAIWVLKVARNPHSLPFSKFPTIQINTLSNFPAVGVMADASGYGTLIESVSAPSSDTLRHVALPIVSVSACQKILGSGIVTKNHICAGDVRGGKDVCFGDSGGGLVVDGKGVPLHVGLVSWGAGCGRRGMVGVWTRTSAYSLWIQSIVNQYGWKAILPKVATTTASSKPKSVPTSKVSRGSK
jgi:secreted trypsin-like serine protease